MTPRRDIKELTPPCREMVGRFLEECAKRGIPSWVFEARRTPERQAELYAQGRTTPGRVVTWTMKSRHIDGEAVDIIFKNKKGWTWDEPWKGAWTELGELGEACGLTWGGRWKSPDRPHFELPRLVA